MANPILPTGSFDAGVSFLPTMSPEAIMQMDLLSSKTLTASVKDADAELLMKLWSGGKLTGKNSYSVPDGFSKNELSRLKTSGLVVVNGNGVEFTQKAKNAIKTMVLGEQNKFMEKRQKKPYSLILAESKKAVRTSNLTHTAQTTSRDLEGSEYIYSRRVALIDPSGNHFKEYTARVYHIDGEYEVWTFHGRIGGTQVSKRVSSMANRGSAIRQVDTIIGAKIDRGYSPSGRYGIVRNPNTGARIDLSGENGDLPGVSQDDSNNEIQEREVSKRTPVKPKQPTTVPQTPAVVPELEMEQKNLPEGFKLRGPTRVDTHPNEFKAPSVGNIRNGYFIVDKFGGIVPKSIGSTPAESVKNSSDWVKLIDSQYKLPDGYTIIGPPREATLGDLFLIRDKFGVGVAVDKNIDDAVKKAQEIAASGGVGGSKMENKDPVFVEQKNTISGLANDLPSGFRFDYDYDQPSKQYIWKIVDPSGNTVSGSIENENIEARNQNPKLAYDAFRRLRAYQAKQMSEKYMEMLMGKKKTR